MDPVNSIDSGAWFPGGSGMFIQYHDIIKPVYLTLINKLLITKNEIPLPLDLLENFSQISLVEWYLNRKNINPLIDLDIYNKYDKSELDELLEKLLQKDPTIYQLSPGMKILKLLSVYNRDKFSFPIFVYSEKYNEHIEADIKDIFKGTPVTYLHGDLNTALRKLDTNFTYIFSDIELAKTSLEILIGAYSHVLISYEYRYNYLDANHKTLKYDSTYLMKTYPVCRVEMYHGIDMEAISKPLTKLSGVKNDRVEKPAQDTNSRG